MKFIYLLTSFLKVTNIYAEIVYFFFLKKVTLLKQTVSQERIFFLNLIPSEFLPKSVSITWNNCTLGLKHVRVGQ